MHTKTTRKMNWIKVSDRLPEFDDGADDVLFTLVYKDGGRTVIKGYYDLDNDAFLYSVGGLEIKATKVGKVVAWMPVPDAYKG